MTSPHSSFVAGDAPPAIAHTHANEALSALLLAFGVLQGWLNNLRLPSGQNLFVQFDGECSEFVRFNHGCVRQAGQVRMMSAALTLIERREAGQSAQAQASFSLSGDSAGDVKRADEQVARLQSVIADAGPDPLLMFDEQASRSEAGLPGDLPDIHVMVQDIVEAAKPDVDLVGFLASGPLVRGLLSTFGHRHVQWRVSWFFDYSVFAGGRSHDKPASVRDKAVKHSLAGGEWDSANVRNQIRASAEQSDILLRPARQLTPGAYRAWLAPAAVADLLEMFSWGGFSTSSLRHGSSPLERAFGGIGGQIAPAQRQHFSPLFSLRDDPGRAGVPRFQEQGFVGPASLELVFGGEPVQLLCSPRSAREFGLSHNGYGQGEAPRALSMAPGALDEAAAMKSLGTGLYISNLWYLNFSDRLSCSVTGMTRFASMWVEDGVPVTPLSAMRIDDSFFRIFGSELEAVGNRAHWMADVSTYAQRSFGGTSAPGVLLRALRLAL